MTSPPAVKESMTATADAPGAAPLSTGGARPSFSEAVAVWFKIGCLSFGGPAGQIAMMHREVVDERRWVSDARFLHALNFCTLLPGPEAQQLATYLGWLMHGVRGGLAAGLLFVLPGAAVMLALFALRLPFPLVVAAAALLGALLPGRFAAPSHGRAKEGPPALLDALLARE